MDNSTALIVIPLLVFGAAYAAWAAFNKRREKRLARMASVNRTSYALNSRDSASNRSRSGDQVASSGQRSADDASSAFGIPSWAASSSRTYAAGDAGASCGNSGCDDVGSGASGQAILQVFSLRDISNL